MVIFLTILKWLFNIIAILLALVLVLSLTILLTPIRYCVQGKYEDGKAEYSFLVSWVLHAVTVRKDMDSDEIWLRLFGFRFRKISGGEEKKKEIKPEKLPKQAEEPVPDETDIRLSEPENNMDVFEISPEEEETMRKMREDRKKKEEEERQDKAKQIKQKKQRFSFMHLLKKKEKSKRQKKEKRDFSFNKISSIIDFIRNRENSKVLSYLKDKAIWLLKKLSPKKINGFVRFGFEDPSYTGMVTGIISMFPIAYQEKFSVIPNFMEKELEADVFVSGYIRLWPIIDLGIELYRDKNIRRCKRNFDKLKEEL